MKLIVKELHTKNILKKFKKRKRATEDKSLQIVEFTGKHWDVWSETFLARGKRKGYTKILLCRKDQVGFDKVPTVDEYNSAVGSSDDEEKKGGEIR